jgi:RHS repeat-associated protein
VQELDNANPPNVTANVLTGLNIDEYFSRTDSSGAIGTTYTYEPFGKTTLGGAATPNPYQFTGRENDATGLYYYRARYCSPTYQRFSSQDPIGFRGGSPNVYAYVLNAPAVLTDPFGLNSSASGVEYSDSGIPVGELGLESDLAIPVPNGTVGVDSPLGGVQTTLPFATGGNPTTVQRGPSWTQPLLWPPDAVAKLFPQKAENSNLSLQCQVRSPFGGVGAGADTQGNGNASVLGPQINFPIPDTGVNVYVGIKWY